jgi:hypothetical protein
LHEHLVAAGASNRDVQLNVFFHAKLGSSIRFIQPVKGGSDSGHVLISPSLCGEICSFTFHTDAELETAHQVGNASDRRQAQELPSRLSLDKSACPLSRDDYPISLQTGQSLANHRTRNRVPFGQLVFRRETIANCGLAGNDLFQYLLVNSVGKTRRLL